MNINNLVGVMFGIIIGRFFAFLFKLIFPSLNWYLSVLIFYVGGIAFFVLLNKNFDFKIKIRFLEKKLHPVLWCCIVILLFSFENFLFVKINL